MRLGCCGTVQDASLFKTLGFDFLEVNVQAVLRGDDSDEAWSAQAPDPVKLGLPIEAANCLVPASHPVVGPGHDLPALQQYMARVTQRARKLGISRLVFGSGGARRCPADFDPTLAAEQIASFTAMAGDLCQQQEIILVLEHLNAKETNTLNRLSQMRRLCEQLQHQAVACLVDSYHYGLEHEGDEDLLELGDRIQHVHVAEPVKRFEPGGHGVAGGADAFDFEHFFALLRKVGYNQRVSFECSWSGQVEQTAPAAIAFTKQSWAAAGGGEN